MLKPCEAVVRVANLIMTASNLCREAVLHLASGTPNAQLHKYVAYPCSSPALKFEKYKQYRY